MNLHVLSHPLAQASLSRLRSAATPPAEFRQQVKEISVWLFADATRELPTEEIDVATPMAKTRGVRLRRPLVLAPILRAGLGMAEALLPLVPQASLAHIGIFREETTAQPVPYYAKFPPRLAEADVFVLDPMLATGQSAIEAVRQLKVAGAAHLRLLTIISCPPGVEAFRSAHPDTPIHTAAVDLGLNERFFIIPGLGDAGDRYFGT